MAHDDPTTKNYTLARRLDALVIQDLGTDVLAVMNAPEPARPQLMKERIVAKVVRYLRPPDPKDKWWETLIAADKGQIDKRLDEAARLTPITVNQCALSPLKNVEASKDSRLAFTDRGCHPDRDPWESGVVPNRCWGGSAISI